jgi:hypothetical protein
LKWSAGTAPVLFELSADMLSHPTTDHTVHFTEDYPMATGINRADPYQRARAGSAAKSFSAWQHKPCVFISHQQNDIKACQAIADYLLSIPIDVYFDKYDKSISELVAEGNANKVTEHIQRGINFSTHMICVVSLTTVKSYWVPFEVGYGYGRITLGVLTLKGVTEEMLPEYLRTTNVIRGTKSLNNFLSELLGRSKEFLESTVGYKSLTQNHPLDSVLDYKQ